MVNITNNNGEVIINISGEMNIFNAQEIASSLKNLDIDAYSSYKLDLSNVSEIDSSGFQLLVSLKKTIIQKGKTFLIDKISEPVKAMFDLYNVSEYFLSNGGNN